ncbi:MAG TPA: carbohydrate porin [Candidatus Acidoferrales bacterium]|nr:carbohydrate porin [Candidatus Acidoferrales bacterium]
MKFIFIMDGFMMNRRASQGRAQGAGLLIALALAFMLGAGPHAGWAQSQAPSDSTQTAASDSPDAGEPPSDANADPEAMFPHFKSTRFWLSGQANFIFQTHPPFHAAYSGKNSLDPNYEKATSRVMTLYTGVRLNDSTELLADVEDAAGAGLSNSLGLAGITNLDVVRIPGEGTPLSTAPYLARGMIHKVFGLSKDKVENDRNFLSLFDELPRRRLEVRFGKFTLPDFLDANSVGSDTHFQFTNWTIDQNGAWDYAADTRGYTVGVVADYEDRNWGFRFVEALMPKIANGIDLVWKPWQAHSENWQYELRRGLIPKREGAVRLLAYTNYANMGIYRDAVTQFIDHSSPEPETVPEITNHPWHITRKYGFGINVEQSLTHNLTAFGRFGWDNDKTESFAFTEVGQTFAGGLGANGALWHRKQDRAGIAFVSNAIKKDHQVYLADGGFGFLLGDGRLNYGRENIVESYYTAHVWRGIYIAPGLQHVVNPGYNRDRGPVLVPSLRAHVEF